MIVLSHTDRVLPDITASQPANQPTYLLRIDELWDHSAGGCQNSGIARQVECQHIDVAWKRGKPGLVRHIAFSVHFNQQRA